MEWWMWPVGAFLFAANLWVLGMMFYMPENIAEIHAIISDEQSRLASLEARIAGQLETLEKLSNGSLSLE